MYRCRKVTGVMFLHLLLDHVEGFRILVSSQKFDGNPERGVRSLKCLRCSRSEE
jgi:hypothetical protein